eukprot:scaffold1511_cov354-Pavlova_lutheri.AAC.3
MTSVPRRATWSVLLLFIGCLATVSCVEEAFLLDDPVDFCGVPGTANVRACNYIVGELEDQNPSLDFDFVCSREEDCKDGILDGQVVDWYPSGCNGPKIKNKLCGCCVFIPMPEDIAPGAPTNLEESSVTSSSVTLTWEDGTRGIPVETYTVRCFDTEPMDCRSDDFAAEVTDIPRGTEIATVLGLEADSEYTCFVLAINAAEPEGVCSEGEVVMTLSENIAPGIPTTVEAIEVTANTATFTWTDGSVGSPVETYTVRCFDTEPMDCRSDDFAAEVTDIPRGTEIATVPGLDLNTEYTCFVLAVNAAVPDGVCSDGVTVTTAECEMDCNCDGETPICENQECTSADFEVSNEADLRTALDEAEPGQSIQVVGEITLTTDDVNTPSLIIDKAITIVGKRDSVLQSPADASAAIIFIQVNADDVSFSSGLGIRHLKNPVSGGQIDSAVRVNAENFASAADVEFVEFGYSLQGSFDISGSTTYVGETGNNHRHIAVFSMTGTSTIEDVVFSFPDEATPRSNMVFVNTGSGTFDGGLTVRNVIQQDLSIACRQFFNYEAGFANIVSGNSFLSFEGNAWNDRNGGIFLVFPTDDPLQRFEFVSVTNNFQGDSAVVEGAGYKGIFYVTAFSGSWEVGDVSNFFSSGNESPGQTDPSSLRSDFFWINVPGQEEFTLAFDGRVFVDPTE